MWFVFSECLDLFLLVQEIVDQIVDIDLVVNFKCTNENLVKQNLGTGSTSACQEYLSLSNSIPMRNLNLQLPDERLKSSTADAEQVSLLCSFLGLKIVVL